MKNKLLSVLIVLNIFVLSGCGSAKSGQAASTWIDSDIKGNVTADTQVSVKDDFAAASSGMLFGINEALYKLHLERIHFEGIAENAFTDILYGSYGTAIFKILIGLIVYLGGVLIVTNVIFGKRELDF